MLLALSCASAPKSFVRPQSSYLEWTRHYERRMGLAAHTVEFEALPTCGMVEHDPYSGRNRIVFDPSRGCDPREIALHETCHLRYAHLAVEMSDEQRHKEVATCAHHYR